MGHGIEGIIKMHNTAFQTTLGDRRSGLGTTALCLVLVAALTGCQKSPGGQVAAVVNNEEITQQELHAGAPAGAAQNFQAIAPILLQRLIQRNLLADYARQNKLDRNPDYVVQRRQMEQSLLASAAMRHIVGPLPDPSPDDVRKYIADHSSLFAQRERLTLDQVHFPTPSSQQQIKALTALGSIDAIAAKLRATGVNAVRDHPTIDTASIDFPVAHQISALKPGTVFDLSATGTTFISTVTGHSPVSTPPASWNAIAFEGVKRERINAKLGAEVEKLRKDAKISYDPAFKPTEAK